MVTALLCPECGSEMPPGVWIDQGCTTRTRNRLRDVSGLLAELDIPVSRQSSRGEGFTACPPGCDHEPENERCQAGGGPDYNVRAAEARDGLVTVVETYA